MGAAAEWNIPKGPTLAGFSTVLQVVWAAQDDSPQGEEALRRLVERYYEPMLRTLLASRLPHDTAEEVGHGFVARLCEGDIVRRYNRGLGSFRTYIEKCLKHFFVDWLRGERVRGTTPLGATDVEALGTDPAAVFLRHYARELLTEARAATQERLKRDKRAWRALRVYYLDRDPDGPKTQEEFAAGYGISIDEFRGALERGKAAFKEQVSALLAPGVGDAEHLNEELAWFFDILGAVNS